MAIQFGTDGWRAIIADEFTFAAVRSVSRAYAAALHRHAGGRTPQVVVGFDRRFASDAFASAAAEELACSGVDVAISRVPVPTPVLSWAVVESGADGALVVTASHNPPAFNGIKIKSAAGGPAPRDFLDEIEELLSAGVDAPQCDGGGAIVDISPVDDYLARLERLVGLARIRAAGMTIVADAMFGTTAGLLPRLLGGDSTETIEINTAHNPLFPGIAAPEPVEKNLSRLKKVVEDGGADLGLAFDGDGDRIGVVDERGNYVSAQHVFALLARYVLEVRKERGPIIKSVTGSAMVDRLAERSSVQVIETPTGFTHISEAMIDEGASLGGEESGGFGFGFHMPERDGLLAALLVLDYTIHARKHVSELLEDLEQAIGPWSYRRLDLPLAPEQRAAITKRALGLQWPDVIAGQTVREIRNLDGVKVEFDDGSWLLLRPSGTEPLLRLYAEAHDPETVDRLLLAGRDLLGV